MQTPTAVAARLRHEAREHSRQAHRLRALARVWSTGPIGSRDPIRALKLRIAAGERTSLARICREAVSS